jgi:hypothetical protein
VWRKVCALVRDGYLLRSDADGIRLNPDMLEEHDVADLVRKQLEVFTRTVNDLLRDGILSLPEPKAA